MPAIKSIQPIDSASIASFDLPLDATDLRPSSARDELRSLRPDIIPPGYSAEQTHNYYLNGDSSAAQIRLNEFLFSPPPEPQITEFFRAIQKWEGYVLDVGTEVFRARLVRIVGEGPDQEAEIYIEEVDPDDRELLKPGAVFYWTLGYLDRPSGRRREAILRFRRLLHWTKAEKDATRQEAKNLENLFE